MEMESVAMLPNIAQHRSTAVRHLLPFTKWILEPTLGPIQAHKVEIAFMAKTITKQMALQWDLTNNCMLQADNTLIRRAHNDFPLYNLTTTTQPPTTVTSNNGNAQEYNSVKGTHTDTSGGPYNKWLGQSLQLNTITRNMVYDNHHTGQRHCIETKQTGGANMVPINNNPDTTRNHLCDNGRAKKLEWNLQQILWLRSRPTIQPGTRKHGIGTIWRQHWHAWTMSSWRLPHGGCQLTEMRGQTQSKVPGGTGTQAANHHNYEHASTNDKWNQNTQTLMEMEQVQQQNINVTNINSIPTKPNTNSFYNSWGDTLPHPKLAGSVRLAMQNFGGWPQWNKNPKNKTIWQYLNKKYWHLCYNRKQHGLA